MSYCPQCWDSRAIYNNRKTRCIFEYLMNYSSFSCFMAIFISYCLYLGFSVGFAWPIRPDTCLRDMTKKSSLRVLSLFHELLPIVLGFNGDIHVSELWPKTHISCVLWAFSWVIAHSFGVAGPFTTTVSPDRFFRAWPSTRRFRVLWPFSWVIAYILGF